MNQQEKNYQIAELISRFLNSDLSSQEIEELNKWIDEDEHNQQLWNKVTNDEYLQHQLEYWEQGRKQNQISWEHLLNRIDPVNEQGLKHIFLKYFKYAAILIPVLLCSSYFLFFFKRHTASTPSISDSFANRIDESKIHTSGKSAQLILSNGSTIALTDSNNISLTEKDSTRIYNFANTLKYLPSTKNNFDQLLYNYLVTPRGGEYKIELEDGTKVWLNAATTLKFPVHFAKGKREVYLSGEAYFEVKHETRHPFIVHTSDMKVKVYGTKFNIQAYPDEPVHRSSLVEGLVSVSSIINTDQPKILHPGFEAVIENKSDADIKVDSADMEKVLSWKNDQFIFNNESLEGIMRTLSRWYDVKIIYKNIPRSAYHFTGKIRRYSDIGSILLFMEMTGKVKFILKDKKLIVDKYSS